MNCHWPPPATMSCGGGSGYTQGVRNVQMNTMQEPHYAPPIQTISIIGSISVRVVVVAVVNSPRLRDWSGCHIAPATARAAACLQPRNWLQITRDHGLRKSVCINGRISTIMDDRKMCRLHVAGWLARSPAAAPAAVAVDYHDHHHVIILASCFRL